VVSKFDMDIMYVIFQDSMNLLFA